MDNDNRLTKSELKVMNVLWKNGDIPAKNIYKILEKEIGWKKTTTYTVIKKCIEKNVIQRIEPDFICHALITKEQTREYETTELINKLYDGADALLMASIIGRKNLTSEEIEQLRQMINDLQ